MEFIVADGGSGDRSPEIIDRYRERISKIVVEQDDRHYFGDVPIRILRSFFCMIGRHDEVYAEDFHMSGLHCFRCTHCGRDRAANA